MYPGGRPGTSWEDPSRNRPPGEWPNDQYRPRDEQPHHRAPGQHPEMVPHASSSTSGGPLYHPLPPQQQQQPPPQQSQHGVDQYPMQPQMFHAPPPAPRQRTAIACRYCRRRKIRCSGFDSNSDGRCGNCIRFNQECVFTPVSSQTQAFVPAHARYPQLKHNYVEPRGPNRTHYPQLYGPHGQPLPYNMLPAHGQPEYMQGGYAPPSPSTAGPPYARSYEEGSSSGGGYDSRGHRDDGYSTSLPPLGPGAGFPPPRKEGDYNPHTWRPPQVNPPSSPPATLPPPRQFSPPRGGSNGYPPTTLPPPNDGERPHMFPGPLSQHPLSPGLPSMQRRSSDPRDKDGRDPRQGPENMNFPYPPAQSNSTIPPVQTNAPPRSSSAGPPTLPPNPLGIAGPLDPPPGSSRSAADHKMLSSLTWKP